MKLLAGSDFHFSDVRPRCRVDNWYETQRLKAEWVVQQINEYKAPLFVAGDFFDTGKVSPYLTSMLINIFSKAEYPIYAVAGNHEMPYHNINHLSESSYNVLMEAGVIKTIEDDDIHCYNFNEEIGQHEGMCMAHISVYEKEVPPFMPDAHTARDLLESYPYKIWITGDIHTRFHVVHDGKILLNPGGLLRIEATKKNMQTGLMYYDSENMELEYLDAPIIVDAVQDEYLQDLHEREERMSAYVIKMKSSKHIHLDYKKNMTEKLRLNKTKQEVATIIWKGIEGELK